MKEKPHIPLLANKAYDEPSVFRPENLLREARRQKAIPNCLVPSLVMLDPDGDLADYLSTQNRAVENECWACYHSVMYTFRLNGKELGIVPNIVGASYAVLVAEQLFASGCELLISVTSAGIITEPSVPRRFALLTEAVRDEGASYHYLPAGAPARLAPGLLRRLSQKNCAGELPWFTAKSWTTDAPYRETPTAIAAMQKEQIICVEMEAAALYAFAEARSKAVVCFAHLTNTMAQQEGDFEKGEAFGSLDTLALIGKVLELGL
jgi:uridine phosphorylase